MGQTPALEGHSPGLHCPWGGPFFQKAAAVRDERLRDEEAEVPLGIALPQMAQILSDRFQGNGVEHRRFVQEGLGFQGQSRA
jgi:hypothetical protein